MDKCSCTKLQSYLVSSVLSTVETWLKLNIPGEGKSEGIVTGRFIVAWPVSGGEGSWEFSTLILTFQKTLGIQKYL